MSFIINPYVFVTAGGTPISNTFLQTSTPNTSTLTTFSFTSQNFGTADSTRRLICAVHALGVGGSAISSATIGGISATIHTQTFLGTPDMVGIISALVPTGTSGTVSITFNGNMSACGIALWRQINESVASTFDAKSNGGAGGSTSVSMNIPSGGSLYAAATGGSLSGTATFTWSGGTGVSEQYDSVLKTQDSRSGASGTGLSSATGQTVQATMTSGSSPSLGVSSITWI